MHHAIWRLTQAVRRFRNLFHGMSDWQEAFGKEKRLVLLSDPYLERIEDKKVDRLKVQFDGIGSEPILAQAVWKLRIGGRLAHGGEAWREHWAEGE